MNSLDLTGRTALVIRAGGDLGRAGARMLSDRGARVIVTDGDGEALAAHFGRDDRFIRRTACACDADALAALAAEFPEVDVLVHCAAPSPRDTGECWEAIRVFAPAMKARGRGSIIAVSPASADADDAPATPAALDRLVLRLAPDLQEHGVRVNTVCPDDAGMGSAVAFLASDRSRHVTGSSLTIEGSWSAMTTLSGAPAAARRA